MATVLVFLDIGAGTATGSDAVALHPGPIELLTLAASLGDPVVAATGDIGAQALSGLAGYGISQVYEPAGDALAGAQAAGRAGYLAQVVEAVSPAAVLLDNSFESKEIAARLGIRIGSGVITDVVALDRTLGATKSVLAGAYTVSARVGTGVPVFTVKSNSATPAAAGPAAQPAPPPARIQIEVIDVHDPVRVVQRSEKPASGRPELTEARIIVAGGRGVDGNFRPVEELADALGAAVGASRAATDAGWIEHSAQVGQTGKTVSPQLYISAGISGAIQQKAGMQTAGVIVAVNNDSDSPVFEIADFGIVGDLFEVLPQAAEEIRRRRG